MLLRYERQLKAEIQARQAAESAAAEALAALGGQTPGSGNTKGQQHSPEWQHQQEQLQQVRIGCCWVGVVPCSGDAWTQAVSAQQSVAGDVVTACTHA